LQAFAKVLVKIMEVGKTLPRPHKTAGSRVINALSFDIEDYFQVSNFESFVRFEDWRGYESRVERNTDKILQVLADHDSQATFFVLGWVAEQFPGLVERIALAGHELATHGYRHQLVYRLTPEEFRRDLRLSIDLIEQSGGQKVLGYRAPSFSITAENPWALDILHEEGLKYDSSIYPIRHPRYGMRESPLDPYEIRPGLLEFPLATSRWAGMRVPVAGGGYFRIFPYFFIRWGLRRINREGRPFVFYLHPWEFDPDQPRLKASLQARFRHYRDLDRTEPRLRALMGEFEFTTVGRVLAV
jgi:polysaccharide deacetylase family protein (PEP-CTERM system associated)